MLNLTKNRFKLSLQEAPNLAKFRGSGKRLYKRTNLIDRITEIEDQTIPEEAGEEVEVGGEVGEEEGEDFDLGKSKNF